MTRSKAATERPGPPSRETAVRAPVTFIEPDQRAGGPEDGVALCLSGGGYRAMVFHAGALIRLNEAGMLRPLKRVSSVSGGSIAAGVLGLKWSALRFGPDGAAGGLMQEVIEPILKMASRTIDVPSIIKGKLLPGSVADKVAAAYDRVLFKGATLRDLPTDEQGPRFVINATSVQTGALWRFSRPYMADYLVGQYPDPDVTLARAVAASSAFPPALSPAVLRLDPRRFVRDRSCPLQQEPYTRRAVLTDGGVYDNLGLETAWKRYRTLLVSDAGGKLEPSPRPRAEWVAHTMRVLGLIDNQVRALRKRQLITSFKLRGGPLRRRGTYWGIRTQIADYGLADPLPCPEERTLELANIPTRLAAMDSRLQKRLINWGYAVCDAAIRRHVDRRLGRPDGFPFAGGV